MLTPDRRKTILDLSLPIIGGMISQTVLNSVDAAMVGRFGDAALAAVGFGSFGFFLAMSVMVGIGIGVQTMASRRVGQGRTNETAVALNGGLLLSVMVGIPMMLLLLFVVKDAFPLLNSDPVVVSLAVPYLQIRIFALVGVGMNHSFRGYWNGVNLPMLYMRTLILMHLSNVFLNWVFIFGNLGAPAMGVAGAGLASAIATFVGTAYYIILGFKHAKEGGFLGGIPSWDEMRLMLRLAGPNALQQFFFFSGVLAIFWVVGLIGTPEVAALNVLIQLYLFILLPAIGFGMGGTTLVGQALGRRELEDAEAWGWDVVKLATLTVGTASLFGLLYPEFVLGFFLTTPATLELARIPLQITMGTVFVDTVSMVLMNSLIGAGDMRRVLVVAVLTQWAFFLPAAYIAGPLLGGGLLGVWLAQLGYRVLQALLFVVLWHGGRWKEIRV